MVTLNLKSLIGKLNETCKISLENAAGLCLSNTQYNVEIEHWLIKLVEDSDSEMYAMLRKYQVDIDTLLQGLHGVVQKLKSGNSRPPALSPTIVDLARESWMFASIEYGHNQTSSAHILCALLQNDALRRQALDASAEFNKIAPDSLRDFAGTIMGTTPETKLKQAFVTDVGSKSTTAPSNTPALDKYTINLSERAQNGDIDPVLGRDREVRQIIDILTRRRQNNPILTGEAGVGKTAVVEGFALQIAAEEVPDVLKGVCIRSLDLGLLQAGASIKGEFENRLKSVIAEVKASVQPIILFIDEAHTMIGAGGKEGQGDAANLLKPALARGELRTIAATTWAEYKKYFERDPALTRRFQVVKIEEPDEGSAIEMMRGISKTLQQHHHVRILDEAIVTAVKLSSRYISGRQLPDKSVSLLDTACARVALNQSTTPAVIADIQRQISQCDTTIELLEKEQATGETSSDQIGALNDQRHALEQRLQQLNTQWEQEKAIIDKVLSVRAQLEQDYLGKRHKPGHNSTADATGLPHCDTQALKQQLTELRAELAHIQGESPLMRADVDKQAVAEVVANWTGIPVGRMHADEINAILQLQQRLEKRVVGQSHAMAAIAQNIHTSSANLTDPKKPIGVFLLVGPSGVGKTETALALAEQLYGGEQNITVINMSEFKEEHKVSMLLGSPPGYVGYGEGGVLTEAVRRKPYSIVLLDEMEKAHVGVQDIFYNVFDKGTIKDGEGRDIDFKNTVIIMTSNAGESVIRQLCSEQDTLPQPGELLEQFRPVLLQYFKPAFLGRCEVISYYPLGDDNLRRICELSMEKIRQRVKAHYNAGFSYSDAVPAHIVARSQEVDTGARTIDNILTRTILPELATECLTRMANEQDIKTIHIDIGADDQFVYNIS